MSTTVTKELVITAQEAEIERLRTEQWDISHALEQQEFNRLQTEYRVSVIEECAQVVRDMQFPKCNAKLAITSAIRALKEKP